MKNVTTTPRICEKCNESFLPHSNSAKWCDTCCTHTCRNCGKQFVSRRRRAIAFCSIDCTNVWQDTAKAKEQARERTTTIRGSGKVIRCATCDTPFYVPGWRLKALNTKYCSHGCRNYPADMKGINRVLRFPAIKERNKLEEAGRNILEQVNGDFLEQQVIGGKFVVDALYPDQRLIIQWDGDFWHGNPAIYQGDLYPIQQTNTNRDKACNAYLAKCGYTVLRFWERDVHSSPSIVADAIRECLASSSST